MDNWRAELEGLPAGEQQAFLDSLTRFEPPVIPDEDRQVFLDHVRSGLDVARAASRTNAGYTSRRFRSLARHDPGFATTLQEALTVGAQSLQDGLRRSFRELAEAEAANGGGRYLDKALDTYLDERAFVRKQEVEVGPVTIVVESAFARPAVEVASPPPELVGGDADDSTDGGASVPGHSEAA